MLALAVPTQLGGTVHRVPVVPNLAVPILAVPVLAVPLLAYPLSVLFQVAQAKGADAVVIVDSEDSTRTSQDIQNIIVAAVLSLGAQ